MKYASLSLLHLIMLGVLTSWVAATSLEFRRVPHSSARRSSGPSVHPRGTSGDGPGDNSITNHLDLRYSTNITLGGKDFVVLLDTGSTDLWVLPDDRDGGLYNITDIPVQLGYGGGSSGVEGPIAVASFQMGSFNVSQQAFLHVESYTGVTLKNFGIDGLLGLSFDFGTASPINQAVTARNATWGSSVLSNIFSQDGRNGSNFVALDLSRTDDLEDIDGGSFSIGEYAEPWKAVAQAPRLYQYPQGGDRWTTLLEGITVGGTPLNFSSLVRDAPDGRLVTLLDTGNARAHLPPNLRNDLYSRIPGAVTFTAEGQPRLWLIPCNTTTMVEFTFSGQRFPIHPLDLSYLSAPLTAGGQQYTACIGSIDGDDVPASQGYEVSLGDIFLRNVYSVGQNESPTKTGLLGHCKQQVFESHSLYHSFDFGDPNGTAAGQPYMQLLAQTDPANATAQVAPIRNRTMADLPPEIEPARLLELLKVEDPTISTATPPCRPFVRDKPPNPRTFVGIGVLVVYGQIHGPGVIVRLMATNALIRVTLLAFSILNLMQRLGLTRRPTSGDGPGNNRMNNHLDVRYSTNITLGGKEFVVALDTGSADLWVFPDDRGEGLYNITDIPVDMRYGDGSIGVNGTVAFASFQMGSFDVPQQAFLHVESANAPGLKEYGVDGLLGLGFSSAIVSPINQAVKGQWGQNATLGSTVLTNIFSQDGRNESNFIAFDLSRTDDLEDTDGGSFSIGEYADQWKAVAQAPKLYQYPQGGYWWTTLLDGITVGGTPLSLSSLLRGVPEGRLIAFIDTGDPAAVLQRNLANDLYSYIPGAATFSQGDSRVWIIPCNTTTIVEFTFGGQRIPIHPLDLSFIIQPVTVGGQNYTVCMASMPGDDGLTSSGIDMSLGTVFLRNVYSVFDFGDSDGTAAGQPYIQLLAKTDPAKATAQVALIRSRTMADLPPEIEPAKLVEMLSAEDPTIRPGNAPLSAASFSTQELPSAQESRSSVDKYGPAIIGLMAVNAVIGVILLALSVFNLLQRRGLARGTTKSALLYVPVKSHATSEQGIGSGRKHEDQLSTTGYSQLSV
ncbi:hypothetical protein H1R20_g8656, partial [Candolleomyces eurysporus]